MTTGQWRFSLPGSQYLLGWIKKSNLKYFFKLTLSFSIKPVIQIDNNTYFGQVELVKPNLWGPTIKWQKIFGLSFRFSHKQRFFSCEVDSTHGPIIHFCQAQSGSNSAQSKLNLILVSMANYHPRPLVNLILIPDSDICSAVVVFQYNQTSLVGAEFVIWKSITFVFDI